MYARLMCCLSICALHGCAYTHVAQNGDSHVIGFVHITIPAKSDNPGAPVNQVEVKSIGVSAIWSDVFSGISLGYNDQSVISIGKNSCVALVLPQKDAHPTATEREKQ